MARRTTDTVITVGTSDGIVLSANPNRKHMIVSNCGTQSLFLRLGQAAAANSGIALPVNGNAIELDHETIGNGIGMDLHAIAAGAGGAIAIWSSED